MMGDLLHNGTNNPINTRDIMSGASAIIRGGTLLTIDSSQLGNIGTNPNNNGGTLSPIGFGPSGNTGANANSNGGNAYTIDSGRTGSAGGK